VAVEQLAGIVEAITLGQEDRIALLFHGDRATRNAATIDKTSRLGPIADALASVGLAAEPAVYSDEMADEVREQLLGVRGVLVWVDPVSGNEDRKVLDVLLRDVASSGVFVSAHPDVIIQMGTKEVLYTTRDLSWGTDTDLYRTPQELDDGLAGRLARGQSRVIKQYRGNGGIGVWKIELANPSEPVTPASAVVTQSARNRDDTEIESTFGEFLERSRKYFAYSGGGGRLIDQPYQPRIAEGFIRCYLVENEVVGFCRQYPAGHSPAELADSTEPPKPPERVFGIPAAKTMFAPDEPTFAVLRRKMQDEWVPAMQRLTGVNTESLPVLWDADFLYGPRDETGADTYVLSEINVSAVAPFPEQAVPKLAHAVADHVGSP
jgi:hypothetical protein